MKEIVYTEALGTIICSRLAEGASLKSICKTEGIPSLRTVYRWLATVPPFLTLYQQAREDQADTLADEMLEIADDRSGDVNDKGEVNHDVIARARLRVDTRKFLASKLKPKKYGDKLAIGGAEDLPPLVQWLPDRSKAAQFYFALRQVAAANARVEAMKAHMSAQDEQDLLEIMRKHHPEIAAELDAKYRTPLLITAVEVAPTAATRTAPPPGPPATPTRP